MHLQYLLVGRASQAKILVRFWLVFFLKNCTMSCVVVNFLTVFFIQYAMMSFCSYCLTSHTTSKISLMTLINKSQMNVPTADYELILGDDALHHFLI